MSSLSVNHLRKKRLSGDAMPNENEACVCAMTVFWSLLHAHMPMEVMKETERFVHDTGLPQMSSCNLVGGISHTDSDEFSC